MDLQMPRLSGVGAVQALREQWPEARVLIVTTFAQDEHLFEALRAGARGYLLKDAGSEELASAIKTVHEGGSLVQPMMAAQVAGPLRRDGDARAARRTVDRARDRDPPAGGRPARGTRRSPISW